MKKLFIVLPLFIFIAAGCNVQSQPEVSVETQKSNCDKISLTQNTDYTKTYSQIVSEETSITGILKANPKQTSPNTLMRYVPYSVDGVNLYAQDNLDSYVGKKVTIEGKVNKFELEGQNLTEIWPKTLCVQN